MKQWQTFFPRNWHFPGILAVLGVLLALSQPAAADPVNLALNKPVVGSSNLQVGLPEYVVDGSYETVWYSYQGVPSQIHFYVDLGSVCEISRFVLIPSQTEDIVIESSLDGETWDIRYTETIGYYTNGLMDIAISEPFEARYIRYTGINYQQGYVGVIELEVYGVVAFAGGDGSAADPWQIGTPAQLDRLREYTGSGHADKYFVLTNDIDMDIASYNEGEGWEPVGSYVGWEDPANEYFCGNLDGAGYTVSGLYINRPAVRGIGLFGLTDGASISDLTMTDADITGDCYVGVLVGFATGTFITGVDTSGAVTASGGGRGGGLAGYAISSSYISQSTSSAVVSVPASTNAGGLVAQMEDSTVEDASASGDVTCDQDLSGGLVGEARNCTIIRCHASGKVIGDGQAGGLVGELSGASVLQDSYATGAVDSVSSWDLGGLIGRAYGPYDEGATTVISGCFATGPVTGYAGVGGFAGSLTKYGNGTLIVTDCYADGAVAGTNDVGGFAGSINTNVSLSNAYAAGAVTGSADVGGFAGVSDSTLTGAYYDADASGQADMGKGEALGAEAMMQAASFVGWEFPDVWRIAEGITRPYLAWQPLDSISGIGMEILADDGSDVRGGHILIYGEGENDRTVVESTIAGTFTEAPEGEQQLVTRASLDGRIRAVAATGAGGQSRTWYETLDDESGLWEEAAVTLPEGGAFPAGSRIDIEEGADGLQMRIETTITDELQF